jgi:hypothetical protein
VRTYVLVTGVIFGLILAAHVWRVVAESPRLATDPGFVVLTLLAGGLCGWAIRLLRRAPSR